MNLIEQLGGYGKAKKALIDAQNSNNIDPIIYINDQEVLTDCVCDALTQYRRENNLFENGDCVLRIDGFPSVIQITVIDKGVAECIRYIDREPRWSCFKLSEIRHATDKEIKQGYRDE